MCFDYFFSRMSELFLLMKSGQGAGTSCVDCYLSISGETRVGFLEGRKRVHNFSGEGTSEREDTFYCDSLMSK